MSAKAGFVSFIHSYSPVPRMVPSIEQILRKYLLNKECMDVPNESINYVVHVLALRQVPK